MEDFTIYVDNQKRFCKIAPPLQLVAYSKNDRDTSKAWMRTSLNFGIILDAPFKEASYKMNGNIYNARIPTFSCIQPGWICRQINSAPCEKLFFTYNRESLGYFEYFVDRLETILMPIQINSHLKKAIEEIFYLSHNIMDQGNVDRLDLVCAQLISEFIIADSKRNVKSAEYSKQIMDIATYINFHFSDNIDFKKLIARAGLSERTFFRRWNEIFGISPRAYILERRISDSCRMLLETDKKIFQIAAEVGFDDPYYFSRVFKQKTSYSPLEYRRNLGISSPVE